MPSLRDGTAELVVTLVVDRSTVNLGERRFNSDYLQTGNLCHFLPLGERRFNSDYLQTGKFCHFLPLFSQ